MKSAFILVLAISLQSLAQSAPKDSPKDNVEATKQIDPKLHSDVVKLVEVSGARERLETTLRPLLEEGHKTIMNNCKRCTQEFGDEWVKRMLERLKVQDFVDVYVRVYEKYLTEDDVQQLMAFHKARKESKDADLPPALKERLNSRMPTIMSEIMGECTKIGAKLGGQVGAEIEKEHPEFIKPVEEKEEQSTAK
jgi:hypothetical protein